MAELQAPGRKTAALPLGVTDTQSYTLRSRSLSAARSRRPSIRNASTRSMQKREVSEHIAATVAVGRVGPPDDLGPLVAPLLDDAIHWMTAQQLEV